MQNGRNVNDFSDWMAVNIYPEFLIKECDFFVACYAEVSIDPKKTDQKIGEAKTNLVS